MKKDKKIEEAFENVRKAIKNIKDSGEKLTEEEKIEAQKIWDNIMAPVGDMLNETDPEKRKEMAKKLLEKRNED